MTEAMQNGRRAEGGFECHSEAGGGGLGNGARMACALGVAHLRFEARGFGDNSPAAFRRYNCYARTLHVSTCTQRRDLVSGAYGPRTPISAPN